MSDINDDALEAARRELNGESLDSETSQFFYACELSEIPTGGRRGKVVYSEQEEIALFNINDEILAISNICPHEMSPVMAVGFVDREACRVACPLHGWTYDLRTGERTDASGSIAIYETNVIDGAVWTKRLVDHDR